MPHRLECMRSSDVAILAAFIALCGCEPATTSNEQGAQEGDAQTTQALTVTSESFAAGQPIPQQHTEDGDDQSPQLSWSGAPGNTASIALICDDPDAPSPEPWVHWVLYAIDPQINSLAEGEVSIGTAGTNSWGELGYRGPAPPAGSGVHHYHFKVYALDIALALPGGATKADLIAAMDGHILAQGEWVGTYER